MKPVFAIFRGPEFVVFGVFGVLGVFVVFGGSTSVVGLFGPAGVGLYFTVYVIPEGVRKFVCEALI